MTQAVYPGFILSRQQINNNGQLHLCYWVKTEVGPVRVLIENEMPVFFIRERDVQTAKTLLRSDGQVVDIRKTALKHFDCEQVYACYFTTTQKLFLAKRLLNEHVLLYEDDIRHCDRFLMERYIKGAAWIKGNIRQREGYIELTNAKLKAHNDYVPNLVMLSLDIECSAEGVLFSVGLVNHEVEVVIMVGESQDCSGYIIWVRDEAELLQTLMEKITEFDPDVLIGWNVIEFDCVVLAERAEALGIELMLGRGQGLIHVYKGNYVRVTIPGRVVIDGIDTLKNATYHFPSFRLAEVAKKVLGKEKLLQQDNRLAEIIRQFNEDKLSLAAYNLQDCYLVLEIFEKLSLLDFAVARTRLTGLELERMGGSVAAFTNLYLPLLHRSGFIAPNLGEHGLNFDSPGGYVMESTPGLHKNVIVLDFKSLYPSIIRTFMIDPLSLIIGLANPHGAIPGFNGGVFSRKEHHLPNLIKSLSHARQLAKSKDDLMLSQAIKIIMNSFYGVLGSTGCRFYDPRLSSSITLRGHEIMQRTKSWIEDEGFDVIYGDTDSTFVRLPCEWEREKCDEIGGSLMNLINRKWQMHCNNHFDLDSHLEIEFETLYSPFFLPTIRGAQTGSKKRYVGQVNNNGNNELIFKGMETVRSDWTKIAQRYQRDIFEALFKNEGLLSITEQYVAAIRSGEVDCMLLYSKRLGQNLEMYKKNVPPHVKAARSHQKVNDKISYKKGAMVEYFITSSGPSVSFQGMEIDYEHYIEKQIIPILKMLPGSEDVLFKLTDQGCFFF
ncbi:DNA polymerase II [Pseudoalteromonas aurantia]|uniref:DNA polymerase n=1 Tax=Pseudoalteromonas aurantia TaxID=43654 RepID=A0A5S3VAK8_9GAMM|nr:DNA polymerase II [Pseudoalteromonas aurantia]TMO68979.1 DNA polymerase II [Pseudoalteromonas aurantia]